MKRNMKKRKILIGLFVLLVCGIVISIMLGRYPMNVKDVFGIFLSRFIEVEPYWNSAQEALLLNHRLPRVVIACLVGCCLSVSGAAYQSAFQNPMAAPDLLGASSGAAFGAALAIYLRLPQGMVLLCAFLFSLLSVGLVVLMGSFSRGNRILTLVLSGMMISSLFSSGTSFIKLIADVNDQLPAITYWMMGSFSSASFDDLGFVWIPMVFGLACLWLLRYSINYMTLPDDEAKTMGVPVNRLRLYVILASTLMTAASVSVSGMIGWVGLVIPHMVRRIIGNNYQYVIPASMLGGAFFLLMVDNLSRNLLISEIPIGILTSFAGVPFFLVLMLSRREIR